VVYGQDSSSKDWYSWNGSQWTLFSATLPAETTCSGQTQTNFYVSGGQIKYPHGQTFIARGVNVYDSLMSTVITSSAADPLLARFPGLNFVRLNCFLGSNDSPNFSLDPPSAFTTFVNDLTSHGVVVELEHHAFPQLDSVQTGSNLQAEAAWYGALATAFKSNPYVWFGTTNEPVASYYGGSNSAVTTEQVAIYNAIRGAGNGAPILMELVGGGDTFALGANNPQGLVASSYASMTNIVWDYHYYAGSVTGSQLTTNFNNAVSLIQEITSADGIVPIIVGEYGISQNGVDTDPGGTTCCEVVQQSGFGSAAWGWLTGENDNLTDGYNNLTSYGQQVAGWINS